MRTDRIQSAAQLQKLNDEFNAKWADKKSKKKKSIKKKTPFYMAPNYYRLKEEQDG